MYRRVTMIGQVYQDNQRKPNVASPGERLSPDQLTRGMDNDEYL
jgi:hypothetical protein